MSEPEFTREHPDPDAVTHAWPRLGSNGLTPCCHQSPWEMQPWRNRITTDPALVTCKGPKAPAVPPAVGEATAAGRAVATPGTPPAVLHGGDGVPGDASSPLPACRPGGGEEAQPSRPGRARQPAPGTGIKAWEAALTAQNRDSRNRRGKRPGPQITGIQTPPPDGAA